MEVKPGYKQSEVGVIPEDWEAEGLGRVVEIVGGGTPSTRVTEYWDGLIPWASAGDVSRALGRYVFDTADHISELGLASCPAKILPTGTVVIISRGATVGRMAQLGRNMAFNQTCYGLTANARLHQDYLYYAMRYFINALKSLTYGTTFGTVTTQSFQHWMIPLPPRSEQRAIATALSDVDTLIGAIDKLIAKKRDLKQAAMQQLLAGQTRLPGFRGEWQVKRLGDVFSISAGKSKSAYVVNGGRYWVVDMGSVSRDGRLIVSKRTNYQGDFLKVGDLVMPKDDIGGGNIIGKVGYIDADDTYVLGDHVYCLRAIVGSPLFLSYVINGHQTNNALRKKVIGSAQLGLGRKSDEEQEIPFPLPSEQTAIAAVLSDMDAEIAALEARRDKTCDLKQGMMQELLTGRTRLV